jgi:hypothetical protein
VRKEMKDGVRQEQDLYFLLKINKHCISEEFCLPSFTIGYV